MRAIRVWEPFITHNPTQRRSGTGDFIPPVPNAEFRMIENLPPGMTIDGAQGCYVWWVVP